MSQLYRFLNTLSIPFPQFYKKTGGSAFPNAGFGKSPTYHRLYSLSDTWYRILIKDLGESPEAGCADSFAGAGKWYWRHFNHPKREGVFPIPI
jgi:hypothetical protein